jgi:hypothetical protein
MRTSHAEWRKSSFSTDQTACIEIAWPNALTVGIRDSKNPTGRHLTFPDTALHHLTRTLAP